MMKRGVFAGLAILAIGFMAIGNAYADEPFTVGEKWTYKHEGYVPMRGPNFSLVGDRVREVVAIEGEEDEKRWVIREQWGEEDNSPGRQYVNEKRLVDRGTGFGNQMVTIDPPFPLDFLNLESGTEKTLESTFRFEQGFTTTREVTVKRGEDEAVTVPAGEFENCIHVQIEETSRFTGQDGNEVVITTQREQWLHPSVNGVVKETFTTSGFGGGPSQTGTSELIEYEKAEE